MLLRLLMVGFLAILTPQCTRDLPDIDLDDLGELVEYGRTEPNPSDDYEVISAVFGQHGTAVYKGRRESALNDLRNKAGKLGGDYVRIYSESDELDQEFIVRGTAYRKLKD